jgi:hypothetical protein
VNHHAALHHHRRSSHRNRSSTIYSLQNLQKLQCNCVLRKVHVVYRRRCYCLNCFSSVLYPSTAECLELDVSRVSLGHQLHSIRYLSFLIRPPTSLLRNVSRMIGIKFKIRGESILREPKCCVIVSNHQSSLDILGEFTSEKTLITIVTSFSYLIRKRVRLPINMVYLTISGMFGA